MTANPRLWSLMCLIALLVCWRGNGQERGELLRTEAVVVRGAGFVDLTFSGNVKASSAERVSLYSLGDGMDETAIFPSQLEGLGGRPRMLRIFLAGNPPAGHTRLRVCLGSVEIAGTLHSDVCNEGRINRDLESEFTRVLQTFEALPKTQQERNAFVSGFLGRGSSGGTVSAADISLVRGDTALRDLSYFLRLKRGSLAGMDPRHLEAGAHYRRSFLFDVHERARLAAPGMSAGELLTRIQSLQRKWFAGHIVGAGVKLESDAAGQGRWLGLVDAGWGLQSTTRRVSLPGAPGWFRFRWLAGGVEAGREQARVKMGADAALLVQARGGAAPIRRMEFRAQTLNRWLARPEGTARGVRPWLQLDAKLFLLESERMRYGLRLSLQRGSLPPVYQPVKSVQLGFVVESTDGDR